MAPSTTTPPPLPSHNPIPLSASQEAEVREVYYKRVRQRCAVEIKDFAACAINRTISATWACRRERLTMNACMVQFANQAEQDAAREEWFATRDERRAAREAKERRRVEQEKFHREWWGLDENGRRKFEEREERGGVSEEAHGAWLGWEYGFSVVYQ